MAGLSRSVDEVLRSPLTAMHSGGAAAPARKARGKAQDDPSPWRRRAWAGRLFVAPNLVAVAVFMLFPLGFSLYMSFQRWDVFTRRNSWD